MYKIVLADGTGNEWSVYRRYSDFPPFDGQVRRILPAFGQQTFLPPRETLRPLAGLFGVRTADPNPEFIEERRKGLDFYLKELLRVAGGNKTALWNHPSVLTFLDIPTLTLPHPNPLSATGTEGAACPIALNDWQRELERTQNLLADAAITRSRPSGLNHFHRLLRHARKSTDRLEKSLDFYARIERIDDSLLERLSGALQSLAATWHQFEGEYPGETSAASQTRRTSGAPASTTTTTPSSGGTPPIARTPVRGHFSSLPEPTASGSGSTGIERQQREVIQAQDAQLSELSSILQRHKQLGGAIDQEISKRMSPQWPTRSLSDVAEQNQLISQLENGVEATQGKVKTAQRRVRKL